MCIVVFKGRSFLYDKVDPQTSTVGKKGII